MKKLNIYDPAMCCPSGVCGTNVDPKLIQLANFLTQLDKKSFEVNRFSLSSSPQEFIKNKEVARILNEEGVEYLPLFFLDDELIFKGEYPTTLELSQKLGIPTVALKL